MLSQENLDKLVQKTTAFNSLESMIKSIIENDYIPSLSSKNADQAKLAMHLMSLGFKVWDPISGENW